MEGKTLTDRYKILKKIGEGGMARVYKGTDLLLRRTVAVKVLKDQMTGDADFVRRFHREAQAAAGLSHPHIVNIYDVGEEDGNYYIVMEYVDGITLKEYIREKGTLPPEEAVNIASQIAEALVTAHAAGVIHRDIKPQNILFSRDGKAKVVDFGIAIAPGGTTITYSDDVFGSVHYFSPEQARGNLAGTQSDLYSLGIILYEMLTGYVPFSGESPVSIAMKHVQEEIQPPRELADDIPEPLERIILNAVEKNPRRRYQDAEIFLEALLQFKENGTAAPLEEIYDDEETKVMKPFKAKERNGSQFKKKWLIPLAVILFLSISLTVGLIIFRGLLFVPEVTVPEVIELSHSEAVELLTEEGLQASSNVEYVYDDNIPQGHVVRSDPYQGRQVRENRVIVLFVSLGPEGIRAPDLYNKTEAEARIILEQMELEVNVERQYHDEVAEGRIYRQLPGEGASLSAKERVVIYVSRGPEPFKIEDLVGGTLEDALSYLEDNDLKARERHEVSAEPEGTVLGQIPEAGESVRAGQYIDLVISKGGLVEDPVDDPSDDPDDTDDDPDGGLE